MKPRVTKGGHLARPWMVKLGQIVLGNHPSWREAQDAAARFAAVWSRGEIDPTAEVPK